MRLSRREALILAAGGALATFLPRAAFAAGTVDEAMAAFAAGAALGEGGIEIAAPEIAENGNSVPVEVFAPGAVAIAVFADGNPSPGVAKFHFGPAAGEARAATRIRLSKTQNVVALAKLADGSVVASRREVKVTIGGCGG